MRSHGPTAGAWGTCLRRARATGGVRPSSPVAVQRRGASNAQPRAGTNSSAHDRLSGGADEARRARAAALLVREGAGHAERCSPCGEACAAPRRRRARRQSTAEVVCASSDGKPVRRAWWQTGSRCWAHTPHRYGAERPRSPRLAAWCPSLGVAIPIVSLSKFEFLG